MPAMPRKQPDRPNDGRKARRSDPPYMTWRNGAGKWEPGPALRRAGWAVIRLRDGAGKDLPRGLARIMAREINADAEKWKADPAAPGLRYGPARAAATAVSPDADARTLNNAFERFRDHRSIRRLARKTQTEYRKNLTRFIAWADGEHPATIDRKTLTCFFEAEWDRIFAERALGWLEGRWEAAPRVTGHDGARYVADVRSARWQAMDEARAGGPNPAGLAQVNAIIRAVSRFYAFIDRELGWVDPGFNPASRFDLDALKPRLVLPSDAALAELVETADAIGLPSIGDALVILANAGPRPADMVKWTMEMWKTGRITARIQKTGARTDFRFPAVLRRRMSDLMLRREAEGSAAPLILMTDARRVAYTVDHLETVYAQVRSAAADRARSRQDRALADEIEGVTLYDFRKKAITRLHAAGNSRDDIAAITGHSYKTIATILDHYIIPTSEAADRAVDRLDAYMKEQGVKW